MIPTVFNTSDLVTKSRTSYDVLASLVSEVGELAEEVAIRCCLRSQKPLSL